MKKLILFIPLTLFALSSFAQNTWAIKASVGGLNRYSAVSFAIGSKGYIGLGTDNNSYFQDFWEYDPSTNVWTQMANYGGPGTRDGVGFSIGNKGYAGLGTGHEFWEYDPSTNIWLQKANFGGGARYAPVGFSIGNKGYVGTGWTSNQNYIYHNDLWEYDPSTDQWTQKANLPGSSRSYAVGFSIGNKGYIGTGEQQVGHLMDFWEYDQATDTWAQKADFAGGSRMAAVGFSIGAKGYIGTGANVHYYYYKDFWEYDPSTDVWTQKTNYGGSVRWIATGFSVGGKGYLGTGWFQGPTKTFYQYSPSVTGVEEHFEISTNIFPNPFTSSVTFELNQELKNAQLKLFDVLGKEVRSMNFSGKQITLFREKLESGIYFYQISSENKIVSSGKLLAE